MSGETEDAVSGWTVDTLRVATSQQLTDLRTLLDERYATQTKALDAAFLAQQKAVQAALQAAETATAKADIANEKRFESVNEFRAQLADVIATLISRAESVAITGAISEKLDAETIRTATRISELERTLTGRLDLLTSRMDTAQATLRGRQQGISVSTGTLVGALTALGTVIGLVVVVTNLLTS